MDGVGCKTNHGSRHRVLARLPAAPHRRAHDEAGEARLERALRARARHPACTRLERRVQDGREQHLRRDHARGQAACVRDRERTAEPRTVHRASAPASASSPALVCACTHARADVARLDAAATSARLSVAVARAAAR